MGEQRRRVERNMGNGSGVLRRQQTSHAVYNGANVRRYKVLILGASHAGKTTLFRRLLDQTVESVYEPSTSVEIGTKFVRLDGRQPIMVELWDVPHQVYSGKRIYGTYVRGVDGVILVYDATSAPSWRIAIDYHALISSETSAAHNSPVAVLFIGNKADLAASAEPEATRTAREWLAQRADLTHRHELVSALTQQHTLQVLRAMAAMMTDMAPSRR